MGIVLKNGDLSVHYFPEKGMNFVSLKKGNKEFIDQTTHNLFDERYAGLGAMIGPHFHHRNPDVIPEIKNESDFPHLKFCKGKDPFSHGIGRYAPWRVVKQLDTELHCELTGDDTFKDVLCKDLEGQDFKMTYHAKLHPQGLEIELSVQADTASIVGLHTYYALEDGKGKVTANVQPNYNNMGAFQPIPDAWDYEDHQLKFVMPTTTDFGFLPYPDERHGAILLETGDRKLQVEYWSDNSENSWQLWHPEGGSFVCIEPLSAKNPRNCHLSVSKIKILISVE